jgi:hypothetical protein
VQGKGEANGFEFGSSFAISVQTHYIAIVSSGALAVPIRVVAQQYGRRLEMLMDKTTKIWML